MKEAAILFLTDAEFFVRIMRGAGPYIVCLALISLFAFCVYKAN